MKRSILFISIFALIGYWHLCTPYEEHSVQKGLEEFRAGYENAVRQRNVDALLKFYDEKLKAEVQDYWKFALAGGWGHMPYLDKQQSEDYSQFKLLMDICTVKENEVIAVLAHDTGFPFINTYFLVHKYGPDAYRIVNQKGQWKIAGHVSPSDLYDVQHQDMKIQVFPDSGEMAVTQTIIAKRVRGDGKLFFSYIHEGMRIESIESPQGALNFSQLASTVAIKFKNMPSSDTIQLEVRYRGKAGELFVNREIPKGVYVNIQRIEPHMAIVREENGWHLQTNPAPARISITVPKGYMAISSRGVLASKEEGDGTTTYGWEIKEPASAYEFLASDKWHGQSKKVGEIMVSVYLQEGNKLDPEKIIKDAEEITTVFKGLFGPTLPHNFAIVDAPFGWNRPNYIPLFRGGQVSVHEMAHYWWIGAFKSAERKTFDWFTEGFAVYSEALYEEHEKGKQAYHVNMWGNIISYLMSHDPKVNPSDPEKTLLKSPDVATRYQKGACVLHALRFVMGDDNFFKTLKDFVAEFRGMDISVPKFRKVAEGAYGKELGWFFDQWLERAGLPQYRLTIDKIDPMSDGQNKVTGHIEQFGELYKMPLEIAVEMENGQKCERIWVEKQMTSFEIVLPQKPISVELDPYYWVLRGDIKESPEYRIGEFVLKQQWGQKSSEEIAGKYSKELLKKINNPMILKRIGLALYDVKRYEEALEVLKKVCSVDQDKIGYAIFLIWQGHVLDLLEKREEALSVYKKVADMNITDSNWGTSTYKLAYKPSISGYAAERMKEPFKRLENRDKN